MKREQLYILGDGDAAAYYKSEADAVMDAMEVRIKELESKEKKWKNDAANCCALLHLARNGKNPTSTEMIAEADRLEKLEAENERLKAANFDLQSHFDVLKEDYEELKAQVPKWHCNMELDFKRPEDKQLVVIYDGERIGTAKVERIFTDDGDFDIYHNRVGINEPTHWMPLPPPPTTEESSATEKENG